MLSDSNGTGDASSKTIGGPEPSAPSKQATEGTVQDMGSASRRQAPAESSVNLLKVVGPSLVKRALPAILAAVAVVVPVLLRRRRRVVRR